MKAIEISRIDYCQFLTVSQKNYSITYYAEHAKKCSHDVINRFISKGKYTPSLLWEYISPDVIPSENAYIIFDDTVLNKRNTKKIEVARTQYSGAAGGVTTGIGIVNLVYYNPDIEKYWVIDYRIFSPDHDGLTKIDHLLEMLNSIVYSKQIPFKTVLFDTWYSTHKIMQYVFLCVLQSLESKRQKPTQNDLARLTDSDVTMTSHVLRTLQKRGLIERKHIDGDERAKYPKLLPAGKQLIKRATKIMDKFEQEYFLPINNNFDDFMQCLKDLTAG
ncbi:MarR family transcriptional regulator [Francisella sp. XLW-1]|uniref:MarR family transcriptional regulator n=1 Tax=Francisella sp. XLW-1 TaxID=2610887 RepID=UPI00123E1DD9|nr:MarR family transcriptional regulator [Francisella sp. XLW-1]